MDYGICCNGDSLSADELRGYKQYHNEKYEAVAVAHRRLSELIAAWLNY